MYPVSSIMAVPCLLEYRLKTEFSIIARTMFKLKAKSNFENFFLLRNLI
jgi:hypothetical protein